MELNILHLYPDCMSLYGEYANVAVLRRHLEAMGVTVTVNKCLLDDAPDFSAADFIYMGCGTERTQKAALMALKDKGGELEEALNRGAVVLFTGNAMEALGQSVTDVRGQKWPGMGLAEFATVETDRRDPEDVIAHTALLDNPVVVLSVQADAGLDIGLTLIGMHLRRVAIPLRLNNRQIGNAIVAAARTRPMLIGGERAAYTDDK